MTKDKKIIKAIKDIILKNININENKILDDGIAFSNYKQVQETSLEIVTFIKNEKISNLMINEDYEKNKTVENITSIFVLALIDVDPVDFEGDEPLVISELIDTTSFYILESIKKQEINGISFYL